MITIPEPGLQCDHYRCGCYIDPCCFNCPLSRCMYERPRYEQAAVGVRVLLAEGWSEDDTSYIAHVSSGFVDKVRRGFWEPLEGLEKEG